MGQMSPPPDEDGSYPAEDNNYNYNSDSDVAGEDTENGELRTGHRLTRSQPRRDKEGRRGRQWFGANIFMAVNYNEEIWEILLSKCIKNPPTLLLPIQTTPFAFSKALSLVNYIRHNFSAWRSCFQYCLIRLSIVP